MAYHDGRAPRPPPTDSGGYMSQPGSAADTGNSDPFGIGSSNSAGSGAGGNAGAGAGGPSNASPYSRRGDGGYNDSYTQPQHRPHPGPTQQHPPQHQQQRQHPHQQHPQPSDGGYGSSHASHSGPTQHTQQSSPYRAHPPSQQQQQQQHHDQQQSTSSYGYDYSHLPLFPHGYPSFISDRLTEAPFSIPDTTEGSGRYHSDANSSVGGAPGAGAGGDSGPGSGDGSASANGTGKFASMQDSYGFYAYGSSDHTSTVHDDNSRQDVSQNNGHSEPMAPLPGHIEEGIINSTWLLGNLPMHMTNPGSNHRQQQQGTGQGSGGLQRPTIQTGAASYDLSPNSSDPALPSPNASYGSHSGSGGAQASLPPISQSLGNTDSLADLGGWRLAVEPFAFTSGLEGISGLPLDLFHVATASDLPPPTMSNDLRRASELPSVHEEEVKRLDGYLADLIGLMEPFAVSPTNPAPNPPPPYLHTRIARLSTLVRETLKSLEGRSQPLLAGEFALVAPGTKSEMSEAEREMELIRRRRDVLNAKQAQGKRDLAQGPGAATVPRRPGFNVSPASSQYANVDGARRMGMLAPRPPRDVYRCAGCGATTSTEWKDGPDGPHSLCETCGFHYERLLRKRPDGDPDFSTMRGHNPNLVGLGPSN